MTTHSREMHKKIEEFACCSETCCAQWTLPVEHFVSYFVIFLSLVIADANNAKSLLQEIIQLHQYLCDGGVLLLGIAKGL